MKKAIAILAVLSLAAFAGQVAVNLPVSQTDADWLQYDDGTAAWLTWGGMYRGTCFDVQDFDPTKTGAEIDQTEMWFYHHADRPWDTSDVYFEIWNGDSTTPTAQLDQTMVTAVHYAPVYATYSTPLVAEQNFWALANTEMSAGGWPSILGDGAGSAVAHSYYSDDFIVWEPWTPPTGLSNYFVRVHAELTNALDNSTWGSLKVAF